MQYGMLLEESKQKKNKYIVAMNIWYAIFIVAKNNISLIEVCEFKFLNQILDI